MTRILSSDIRVDLVAYLIENKRAENDEEADKIIMDASAMELIDWYCNWHGLIGWGGRLKTVVQNILQFTSEEGDDDHDNSIQP
jgi:hypothetical protein